MNSEIRKTILLVEDELIIAMSQKLYLEQYGYNVQTINTGEKAIQILTNDQGILLDILPESKKDYLENFGYDVILVDSAEKALEVFKEHAEIDLVLMDIDLGKGLDGTQAAEIILKQRDIPILFLSSHTEPDIVEKTEKITSYGYVVKNSSITVLDASIKMAFKLFEAKNKLKNELEERNRTNNRFIASENRYRRIFETTQEGILILDAYSGMIIDVNPFLINLLGYSYELFMGKTIWDLGFLKDIVGNKEKFIELQKNKYIRYENLPLETAFGKIIEVEFISNVYEDINGKVIQCKIRDITERKVAETKINKLLIEKDVILKEVYHRIKNSMNTIKGLLNLQANLLQDAAAIEALKDTESRVQSMMILYDKLYQAIDSNEISIQSYLASLIDEIISNFPNKKIVTIQKDIADFMINAKKLQALGIVINELLTNIMKYAFIGKTEGLISVSAALAQDFITIIIQDNGLGIPESVSFEKSTGFGLMLVRSLTEQIDGTIELDRTKGTKFIIKIPVK